MQNQRPAFLELLAGKGLYVAVQPIVHALDGSAFGYELLGRSRHPDLPRSPAHLFHIGSRLNRAGALSEAFRRVGIGAVASRLQGAVLFANAHPTETFEPGFVDSIAALVEAHPGLDLVLEIHETAVLDPARMRELGTRLAGIGVRFAYDDFGAGQARLNELSEVPPHFVKFDIALVNGLATAGARKQRVVSDLVRLVSDLGSVALAEGIEQAADAEVCRQMGFRLMQGFLFGKPDRHRPAVKDTMHPLPTFDDVAAAAERIAPAAHRTPVLTSRTADAALGAELFFKCENYQRMGAFKFRGAYNALSCFDAAQRKGRRGRILVGQPCPGDLARGAAAPHAGGDRHAARRAASEGRRDPRLWR